LRTVESLKRLCSLFRGEFVVLVVRLACETGDDTWRRIHVGKILLGHSHVFTRIEPSSVANITKVRGAAGLAASRGFRHVSSKRVDLALPEVGNGLVQSLVKALRFGA
jgi:hypothetical protein